MQRHHPKLTRCDPLFPCAVLFSSIGGMHAGVAAARVGARRIEELLNRYGRDQLLTAMNELLDYGERMTRDELAKLPKGVFEAEDIVEEEDRKSTRLNSRH